MTMDEYPSAGDYREIVEEFVGRDKMQSFLKSEKHFLLHTDTKKKVADVSRVILYGYGFTESLRKGALDYESETKSTAFTLHSEASNDDLLADLQSSKNDEEVFDEKRDLRVADATETEEGIEISLEYVNKRVGRRELIAEQDKQTSALIVNTDEANVRTVKQNYEKIDEYNAVTSFFENWNNRREDDDDEENIRRYNISISRLSLNDRIDMFYDVLSDDPGNWTLEDVLQMGIRQGEQEQIEEVFEEVEDEDDLREKLDENLEGITDAVLTGEGLQANGFVQKCRKNGYYFNSVKMYLDNSDVAEKVEILLEFKEGNRQTFDVSIEQGYEKIEDEVNETKFDPDRKAEIRDLFRDTVLDTFSEYLSPTQILEQELRNTELTDVTGVGETVVANLHSAGYDDIEAVRNASVDELQEVDKVGEETAKRLADS
jgi:DNA uptake protein ComE-like DNA-binding protein